MIWKRNGGNITFISKRGKPMYEKDFPQTNATIATLQVNQLVFSFLSVATRAFSIITYCHLLPHSGEKRGILSEKAEEYLLFSQKTLKSGEKGLLFRTFLYFATNRKNSCRFHLEAYDSCETTFYIILIPKPMTQADLIRLYFAKGDVYNSWNYCFN